MSGYILHILTPDKFTKGYIEFMNKAMVKYNHAFLSISKGNFVDSFKDDNVVFCNNYKELLYDKKLKQLIYDADKVIISGIFYQIDLYYCVLSREILNKTYVQSWGGELALLARKPNDLREFVHYHAKKTLINRSQAVLNLIAGEYEEFESMFKINKKHLIAPVCGYSKEIMDFSKFHKKNNLDITTILVGNSGFDQNNHFDIIDNLKRFAGDDIKFFFPLSYGKKEYIDSVIEYGKEKLGNSFVAITEFLPYEQYVQMVANCDITVFNHKIQMALGNIDLSFKLGKKVFIRDNTVSWRHYNYYSLKPFNTCDIKEMTKEEFCLIDNNLNEYNRNKIMEICSIDFYVKQWEKVFDDNI